MLLLLFFLAKVKKKKYVFRGTSMGLIYASNGECAHCSNNLSLRNFTNLSSNNTEFHSSLNGPIPDHTVSTDTSRIYLGRP